MQALIEADQISAAILKHLELKHRLRLRRVNKTFVAAVESWLNRYQRRLHLRGHLRLKLWQCIKLVELSSAKWDRVVLDRHEYEISDFLWKAIQSRLENSKEICFHLGDDQFTAWQSKIDFSRVLCTTITMQRDMMIGDQDLLNFLREVAQCPKLENLHFNDSYYMNTLDVMLQAPPSLWPKVRDFGQRIDSDCNFRELSEKFPNLTTIAVQLPPSHHQSAFFTSNWKFIENLVILNVYSVDSQAILNIRKKWPNLKSLKFRIGSPEFDVWDLQALLEWFPNLESVEFGDKNRVGLSPKTNFDGPLKSMNHPLREFKFKGVIKSSTLLWLLINCPKLDTLKLVDLKMEKRFKTLIDVNEPMSTLGSQLKYVRLIRLSAYRNPLFVEFIVPWLRNLRELKGSLRGDDVDSPAATEMIRQVLRCSRKLKRFRLYNRISSMANIFRGNLTLPPSLELLELGPSTPQSLIHCPSRWSGGTTSDTDDENDEFNESDEDMNEDEDEPDPETISYGPRDKSIEPEGRTGSLVRSLRSVNRSSFMAGAFFGAFVSAMTRRRNARQASRSSNPASDSASRPHPLAASPDQEPDADQSPLIEAAVAASQEVQILSQSESSRDTS